MAAKRRLRVWRLETMDGYPMGHENWEVESSFRAAVAAFPDAPDNDNASAWEYVQVVDEKSARRFYCGNDGAQGWRHIRTGFTIPDYCRQTGGTPEIWNRSDGQERGTIAISVDSPIYEYLFNLMEV